MGKVVVATQVITSEMDPRRARKVILLLAVSMGLLMTGYAIIMPLFSLPGGWASSALVWAL
jgi:hypothetical protein